MNCVQKRDLLHDDKTRPEEFLRAAETYLDSGAVADALAFYLRAESDEGVERVRSLALEEGDTFLLEQMKLAGKEIPPADWRAAAGRAREKGKIAFAVRALRAAGDEEEAASLESQLVRPRPDTDVPAAHPEAPGTAPAPPSGEV